jgi:HTH-type transcriptional regulator, sugar sensing transcriptional regulator
MKTSAKDALIALGFTSLEAQIYCELLKNAPATGYKLAQAVGKAAANVYQALGVLEQKNAVIIDDGASRSFRPVPPEELLAALESGFTSRRKAAKSALERLHAPVPSDKIFQLRSPTQVLTRARQMLADAREVVLFDLFPMPLGHLKAELAAATARGVQVGGIVYAPDAPREFLCLPSQGQPRTPDNWPGAQLTLVVDARQFLVALFSNDGSAIHHAYWSDSVYLSCIQHSGLGCELRLSALGLKNKDPLAQLALLPSMPPGLKELIWPQKKSSGREQAA